MKTATTERVIAALLALLLACPLARAEELVAKIASAQLKGPKAYLGDSRNPMLIVGGKGASVRADLPAGRVRVSAYFHFNNKGAAYRQTEFELSALDRRVQATVESLANGEPLAITLIVAKSGAYPVSISGGSLTLDGKAELASMESKVRLDKARKTDELDKTAGDDGLNELLNDAIDANAAAVPLLLLDRIEVAPLSGPLIVASVKTDRITYKPGMKGACIVTLENLGEKSQTAKLQVELVSGIASNVNLADADVNVEPHAKIEKNIPFDAGEELWGRGIIATVRNAAGADTGAHAFSVITNPYQVSFHGAGGTPMSGSDTWTPEQAEAESEKIVQRGIRDYCNMYEDFAWAPCDFSKLTPDSDAPFYSGQTQYCKKRSSIQTMNRVCHKYGVSCITYGKSCASGLPGIEYALKHPEQMNIFGIAGFAHESISVDVIDRMLENRYRRYGFDEDFWQSWISCWTQIGNLDAANAGCDEIAASAKLLGWDGVRYDGHFNCWKDPCGSARMVKYCVDRISGKIPDFAFGYNYMGPRHDKPEGAFTDVELAACAHGGGMVMSEYYRGLLGGSITTNIGHLQAGGDMVRLHGGYWLAILDDPSIWNSAVVMASGARPMGGSHALFKFGTRFSSYIFDPAMRRLQAPERVITPVGDPGFLWQSFDFEKDLGPGRGALVLQLVNVSSNTQFDRYKPTSGISAPREKVQFKLNLPAGYAADGVFATDDYNTFLPMAAKLENNTLTVPRVALWTLVVVNLSKAAAPKSLSQICDVPINVAKVGGAPAADADTERAAVGIGAAVGPETINQAEQEKIKVTPEILQAIFAQGPPPDSAPREKAYQAADFSKHSGGVDEKSFKGDPTPLALKRNGRPDIHYACGVFYHLNRMQEALSRIKDAHITSSCLSEGRASASALSAENKLCLSDFPDRDALAGTDVLILDNIPAGGLSQQDRRNVLEFVRGGGSLLVLGGWYALSKGAYEGSFLEDALPVLCKQSTYLQRLKPEDGTLTATPDFKAVLKSEAPDFGAKSSVEWIDSVKPRDGARVLMTTSGHQPLLIAGECGKGRVAVFAGSCSGSPETPYWRSDAWPVCLTQVLEYLAQGSEAVTPTDSSAAQKMEKLMRDLDDAGLGEDLGNKHAPVIEQLRFILDQHTEKGALFTAQYILNKPDAVGAKEFQNFVDQLTPFITASPGWSKLGAQYVDAPPAGLENLVAEIAATACKQIKIKALMSWKDVDKLTLLRCIAAAGDKSALPFVQKMNDELDATEQAWDARTAGGALVPDLYATRLLRPFVTYALLSLGKRDDNTLRQFCRGCLDLPYYAWRQRWVLEGCNAALRDAGKTGDPKAVRAAQAAIVQCRGKIAKLDRAAGLAAALFTPELVGMDAPGKKAAAQAIREADCHKALPLCLDFIEKLKPDDLKDFHELEKATLDGVKHRYQSLAGK